MKHIIDITKHNRSGEHIWLEQESDYLYSVHADKEYVLEYACVNYDSLPEDAEEYDFEMTDQFGIKHKGIIYSWDPSGGPFISIGSNLAGYKVKRIYQRDGVTYFEMTDLDGTYKIQEYKSLSV